MAVEQVDLALRLLQLIALALPAVALLMVVMAEMHKTSDEIKDVGQTGSPTVGAVSVLRANRYADFALAQYSLNFFILSALFLILFYFVTFVWLLRIGVALIALAMISLGLSVFVMPRMPMSRVWLEIRSRINRGFDRD